MTNKKLAFYSLIIAAYVALTLALGSFGFGPIQVRVAEVLVVFCIVKKEYIIPLTIACAITNALGVIMATDIIGVFDIVFGTLATFLSCLCAYQFRNILWFNKPIASLLMPVIFNGLIVGAMLSYVLMPKELFMMGLLINGLEVAVGEFISCVVLGVLLFNPLKKLVDNESLD